MKYKKSVQPLIIIHLKEGRWGVQMKENEIYGGDKWKRCGTQSWLAGTRARLWSWQAFRQSVWNELRHWRELMTRGTGVTALRLSSEVHCRLPHPVYLLRTVLWLSVCLHNNMPPWPSLHSSAHSSTPMQCCIFESGPFDSISSILFNLYKTLAR